MKALILAAGRGKRLGEISECQNKCLIEIKGKALIEYSLDNAINIGVDEIVVVVGYRAEDIANHYKDCYKNKSIKYVMQNEQKGLVHAIECSRNAIDGSDFVLLLGDELMINTRYKEFINKYISEDLFCLCGVVSVQDRNLIKKTYSVIQDESGKIYRLIEKPSNPMNNIMGTGNCIFKNEIYDYIIKTPINQTRGEKELPDLIQCAIDDGRVVKTFSICDHYININASGEIHKANSYFSHS